MSFRNLSPQYMFEQLALQHQPVYRFAGTSPAEFEAWKKAALPAVLATLGEAPRRVPPNPQLLAEWQHDGLIKQKWLIDVQEYLSATCLINRPAGMQEAER